MENEKPVETIPVLEKTETPTEIAAAETTPVPEAHAVETPVEEKGNHDVRRMKRLLREKFEAQAELEALKGQIAKAQAPVDTGRPNRDNYNSDLEYFEALSDFKANQVRSDIAKQIQQIQGNTIAQSFQQKVNEAKKEMSDYEEVISESSVRFSPEIQEAIVSSPLAAHVAYALAKDPENAERIASLSPAAAAREIGRIEAKIEAEKAIPKPKPAARPASSAPAPIKPVTPKIDPKPAAPANDSEWLERRRAEKYKLTTKGR